MTWKIQWNFVTRKIKIFKSPIHEHGTNYWFRLHAYKRFWKYFKIRNLGDYHDLCVQSDALMLADVLKTFETCVLKYMSFILPFSSCTKITIASSLKKARVKLDLLTDISYVIAVEEDIRGGMRCFINWYVRVNDIYMKSYDENKKSLYLKY